MSDCVEWTGYRDPKGYGRFHPKSGTALVHRAAYEATHGPIPEGMFIDHLCRNRACRNVEHMELVTNRENTLRGENFIALHARATQCPQGHPYSEANTYHTPDGRRDCRMCIADRKARYRARLAASGRTAVRSGWR